MTGLIVVLRSKKGTILECGQDLPKPIQADSSLQQVKRTSTLEHLFGFLKPPVDTSFSQDIGDTSKHFNRHVGPVKNINGDGYLRDFMCRTDPKQNDCLDLIENKIVQHSEVW
jgi:hypothetical protein